MSNENGKSPDVEKMIPIVDTSIEVIHDYMKGKATNKDMLRTATQTLSTYARLRSADIQAKAFLYSVIKDVADDKIHLRKMILANMPDAKKLELVK